MRFIVYNMRYGTGTGWRFHLPFPFSGYLRPTERNLRRIIRLLKSLDPDIIGLVEVDNGSYRSNGFNQASVIATQLGFDHVYESKYAERSFARHMPVMREQGNAILTNQRITAQTCHYFKKGVKRLVIELEFDDFAIFLVHLSLNFRHRQYQLGDLYALFRDVKKPMIVAGDFNVFWGRRELELFLGATHLLNANTEGWPTFPSNAPKRQLDFVLHSPSIQVNYFDVLHVAFSDHMPLVCDFEIREAAQAAAVHAH